MQKSSTLTSASITASFPTPILTPIATLTSPPTYATIRLAQTQLNANATTVPSYAGDGIHGHLSLTLLPAAYLLISGNIPFIPPVNGPIQPEHPPAATAAQIAEINRLFYDNQLVFRTYMETDKALRNQILAAIPADYLPELADPELGLGNVSCLQILTHLWTTWGVIIDANALRMATPWHPPTPIDKLFTQLDDGVRFATAGNDTPSTPSVVRLGYNIILATGLFEVPCREWRAKAEASKTLANFTILHFRAADQDRRLTTTSGSAGYANAATVARPPPAPRTVTPPPTATMPTSAAPSAPRGPDLRPHSSYCWTHGHLKNPKHNSVTCNFKHADHRDEATATNTLGGSTALFVPRAPFPKTGN